MPNSFTTLWSKDRVIAARKYAPSGFRFEFLFGGPHQSLPSFIRAGVQLGDAIYPIYVDRGTLYLLGRMQVAAILSRPEFQKSFSEFARSLGPFDLAIGGEIPTSGARTQLLYLAPTCTDHILVGQKGTPIFYNLTVPPTTLDSLRYQSKKNERPIKHIKDGRLQSVSSLQGIYRLTQPSASSLAHLIDHTT